MGLYVDQVLPCIPNVVLAGQEFRRVREWVASGLAGAVLEVGFGSGAMASWRWVGQALSWPLRSPFSWPPAWVGKNRLAHHGGSAMNPSTPPPRELTAILTALDRLSPNALTSCPGWTAHHIAAHICGNYEEILRHVEAFAVGRPLERTRLWEEREAPLRELDHPDLLRRIETRAASTAGVIDAALDASPDASLGWVGRTVPVSGFATHLRSEDALHRWDLVGDDDVSAELLAQEELLRHAVTFIGRPLIGRGLSAGAGDDPFVARIRAADQADLIVEAGAGEAQVSVGPPSDVATIDGDPAARLLLLWGRKPTPFFRLRIADDEQERLASQAQALLAGYERGYRNSGWVCRHLASHRRQAAGRRRRP